MQQPININGENIYRKKKEEEFMNTLTEKLRSTMESYNKYEYDDSEYSYVKARTDLYHPYIVIDNLLDIIDNLMD